RQLKEHFGGLDKVPESLVSFLSAINSSYSDYDKDLEHVERILKISSQELFKSNKELNALNDKNEQIIQEKTRDLRRATYALKNAEKISVLGNFSWNVNSGTVQVSEQFSSLTSINSNDSEINLQQIIDLFEDTEEIKNSITNCINSGEKFFLPLVKLKNDKRYFQLEGDIFSDSEDVKGKLFIGVLKDNTIPMQKELERDEIFEALQHYKNAIDSASIVSITDEKGVITYVNEKFCEVSQYERIELLGARHNIINSGYHSKDYFTDMWRQIASGKTWKGVVKNKKKDGTFYWVDSTIVPFSKNGRINQYISIRFDITDKINFQQKIEEQRSFYEAVLSSIPVDIAVFDSEHRYLFVNPFAVNNPEVREFLIGKTDYDYCKQYNKDISVADKRRALFNRAKTGKENVEFVDGSLSKEGNQAYILRRFFP
ncbi:MAG: PAS domain-containing protein, partial [Bacteroidota bacterium]